MNERTDVAVDRTGSQGRLRLLEKNASIYREIVPQIVRAAPEAVLVAVTDPQLAGPYGRQDGLYLRPPFQAGAKNQDKSPRWIPPRDTVLRSLRAIARARQVMPASYSPNCRTTIRTRCLAARKRGTEALRSGWASVL